MNGSFIDPVGADVGLITSDTAFLVAWLFIALVLAAAAWLAWRDRKRAT